MYKQRDLEMSLLEALDNRKITIILGARQTGKTSLLKRLKEIISHKGLFIDLDIYENRGIFSSYTELMNYLEFNGYDEKERFVLFLDEFHTVKGIARILKNLYDNHPYVKIFATGSSSLEIVSHLKESLAGRKTIYHLYPLSFEEFVFFKDEELGAGFKKTPSQSLPERIRSQLNYLVREFCVFGGYPEVVLSPSEDGKKKILRDIFDLFVKKDLLEFLNIRNPEAALNILRYLATNIGRLLNYSDLCSINHVDINTLKRYLTILTETYVIKLISPFYTNKNKEVVKSPKAYFNDPGARNYFIRDFSGFELRADNGFLIENFLLCQFIKKAGYLTQIKFWRDKNGREIDFIIEREGELTAYEAKYKKIIKRQDFASLLYFKDTYKNARINIVNETRPKQDIEDLSYLAYYEI
ncbi:ATP-binding protein [bacterium]|nr:ATP-binding protein [bacterium]